MEKIYRVKLNSKGMPNFSTAVEIEDIPIYGNEHNCMMMIFGECSYAETGCGDCAVVEKVRKALSADRPQGEWICKGDWAECSLCSADSGTIMDGLERVPRYTRFCPNCGARMKGADDYERAIEQMEHDMLYEPTYNSEDGSM